MTHEQLTTPLEAAADDEAASAAREEKINDSLPIVVFTATSSEDGEIVRGILESEGIPVILTNAASSPFGEAFSVGLGQMGQILVAPKDVARALEILALSISDPLTATN
jgi:hypothetical protein